MYRFYQVKKVKMTFYPYIQRSTPSTGGNNVISVRPTYSILDSDSISPLVIGSFASYGNMKVAAAEAVHTRDFNYEALCLQKQSTTIRSTNGSATSRESYESPA